MRHFASRALAGVSALLTVMTAGAADRAIIDTDQKAAAATLAAHFFLVDSGQELTLPRQLQQVTYPPRDLAWNALNALAAATTPTALMGMHDGLALPCEFGGTFTARMNPRQPGVLKLQWSDCVARQVASDPDYRHKLNGPATLELQGNSFTTNTLTLLRVGDASTDVTAYTESFGDFSDAFETRSLNLRMVGLIPMTRDSPYGFYRGDFDYRVTGFWDSQLTQVLHIVPNVPPDIFHSGFRLSIDQAVVSGTFDYDTTPFGIRDEDLFVHRGTFSMASSSNTGPRGGTFSLNATNLHLHSISDYAAQRRGTTLDGRADISWPATSGSGCLAGGYVFRTDQLLENWMFNGEIYNAGALNINGVLTSRYSSPYTEPPTSFPPLGTVQLDVRRIGSFQHDIQQRIPVPTGLANIAQCLTLPTF